MLHTDDLAWYHGVFSWDQLFINEVMPALRGRRSLHYPPPAWIARSRKGAIAIDGDRDFVIIEGVGAGQVSLRPQLDVVIWVETPQSVRESRDAVRIAAGEISAASYAGWMAEENAYMAVEKPWRHADLIVDGRGTLDHDHETEGHLPRPTRLGASSPSRWSVSHAAWDVDAVHGVHAMHSVRTLGTALRSCPQIWSKVVTPS